VARDRLTYGQSAALNAAS